MEATADSNLSRPRAITEGHQAEDHSPSAGPLAQGAALAQGGAFRERLGRHASRHLRVDTAAPMRSTCEDIIRISVVTSTVVPHTDIMITRRAAIGSIGERIATGSSYWWNRYYDCIGDNE
jgi:hypothetical protein